MLRFVVLGSGSAVPSPERNLCSIAMKIEGDVYLIDCGEGTQRQMMKLGISYGKVKMIMITHLHGDHIYGIPGLVYTLKQAERKEPLFIVGPKGIEERVRQLVGREIDFVKVKEIDGEWSQPIEENGRDKKNARFIAFPVEHKVQALGYAYIEGEKRRFDKEKCAELGIKGRDFGTLETKGEIEIKGKTIRIEDVTYKQEGKKVVFTGDTKYSKSVIAAAQGADILFHEGTFLEDMRDKADEDMHSTAGDAARVAKEADVKRLVIYHISNRYMKRDMKQFEAEGKEIFDNLIIAEDGTEILLK
jgi:ribonuclease Z